MYNILLDRLPEEYEGYLIRTDYRIGMQIALCLEDPDLNENDRVYVAACLLFGLGLPPLEIAAEGLGWFLRCGGEKRDDSPKKASLWFDFDSGRIYSSFRKTYGIELHKIQMHWFEFMELLGGLDEDSALSNALQIRGTDTSKMKGKQRADYERLKRNLEPPKHYSQEEEASFKEFWSQFD